MNFQVQQIPRVRQLHKIGEVGKWNYISMTYSLSNNRTKNYYNRTLTVQVIVEDVVTWIFLRHNVVSLRKLRLRSPYPNDDEYDVPWSWQRHSHVNSKRGWKKNCLGKGHIIGYEVTDMPLSKVHKNALIPHKKNSNFLQTPTPLVKGTPLPRSQSLGVFCASIPRDRRGLDDFSVLSPSLLPTLKFWIRHWRSRNSPADRGHYGVMDGRLSTSDSVWRTCNRQAGN